MKLIVFGFLVASVAMFVHGQGIPTKRCPPGEHSVLYCPPTAEPSCDKPYFHEPLVAMPCDIPECFCDTPTIRNSLTGKCVHPEKC